MVANTTDLEKRLWEAADNLRANSKLRSSEYSIPVLGLIFLKYAEHRFLAAKEKIEATFNSPRRKISPETYKAEGAMFVPDEALYAGLLQLPEDANIAEAISNAMKAIEEANPDLKGVLPKNYQRFEKTTLVDLLKTFNSIPFDIEGDVFGRIYEYFLSKFAMTEGQKGGEFFTPMSIVKLIVDIIEPYEGRLYDPACGSGGMFVQSEKFRRQQQRNGHGISIYGQERVTQTVRLCLMNLAVHGMVGDVKEANSYYDNPFKSAGRFDFVMANPPFNVDKVDKERLKDDRARFPLGMPSVDNANYLWIQLFYSALNDKGRAGFVMANSAADARHSEADIRQQLLEAGVVDVMVAIGSNFFFTVTLPCMLWFLDKGAIGTEREDTVLFLDARSLYRQVDRAHRDFTPEQEEFLANIVRLYRGEAPFYAPDEETNSRALLAEHFPDGVYRDIAGLCKVASRAEIAAQGYSLNPGRYVGVAARESMGDFDFQQRMVEIHEQLEGLNAEAHELEERIAENMRRLLGL